MPLSSPLLQEDGMDETLVPLDYPTAGQITDDELHVLIVKALPDGAKMVHEP